MTNPILLALIADGLLSVMDAIIKGLAARYPTFQIAFLRFGFGSFAAIAVWAYMRPPLPSRASAVANASRSILIAITATSFFYALAKLPLAETVALSFMSPLFIAGLGVVLLKEKLDGRLLAALALGFAGMLVMVGGSIGGRGYDEAAALGALAAVVSALTYALNVIVLRVRAQTDHVATIVLFQHIGPTVLLAIPAAFVWTTPPAADLGLFALIGAIGVTGHMMLAMAFARAEASKLAPIIYTALVWAAVFGYVFFGEVPGTAVLSGAALIVVATIVTGRR
jgi:S-adenosylmethionine uptake transporter